VKPRSILKRKIEEIVFPHLDKQGFHETPSRELAFGGGSKTSYPFGTWIRRNGNGSIDLIDFKFDKYAGAKFEFNFAQIQKDGGWGNYCWVDQDECRAYGAGEFGRYRPKILTTSHPVSLSISKRIATNNQALNFKIKTWIDGLNQVENWFKTREVGPYIITFENLPRGITISRGFSKKIVLKEASISFSTSTKNRSFGENNVVSKSDAMLEAEKYYIERGKDLDLSYWLCWQTKGGN